MIQVWNDILKSLKKVEETGAYYVGGTLCLPYSKGREVAMNLNGRGFVIHAKGSVYPYLKNDTLRVPENVTEKVREIYLKHKGPTHHFLEEVC